MERNPEKAENVPAQTDKGAPVRTRESGPVQPDESGPVQKAETVPVQAEEIDPSSLKELESAAESILFASGEPIHIDRVCLALGLERPFAERILRRLKDYYAFERRGIRLLELDNSWQLCSSPDYADAVRRAFEIRKPAKLSQPALEVLTIFAYYQPTTRAYVDKLRGVDSSYTVSLLLERKLIEPCGRLQVPGRPHVYRTTKQFLRAFHLSSLDDLPPMPELGLEGQTRIGEGTPEDMVPETADAVPEDGDAVPETADGAPEDTAEPESGDAVPENGEPSETDNIPDDWEPLEEEEQSEDGEPSRDGESEDGELSEDGEPSKEAEHPKGGGNGGSGVDTGNPGPAVPDIVPDPDTGAGPDGGREPVPVPAGGRPETAAVPPQTPEEEGTSGAAEEKEET